MNKSRHSEFTSFSLFLVYAIFAACSLFLVLIGAKVYENIVTESNAIHDRQTAFTYIQNKLRTHFDEVYAQDNQLILKTENLSTVIYEKDGQLCELYFLEDTVPDFALGERIVPIDQFNITQQEGELLIVLDRTNTIRTKVKEGDS